MGPLVEVKGVDFKFGKLKVLSDISLEIYKGDFVGLIGPNGSGKTTLLKLMLGLYKLQKGSIKLFGDSISNFSGWSKIGYVPQKATSIDPNFPATVIEVAAMGLLSKMRFPKVLGKQEKETLMAALKTVDMDGYSKRRIGELSGGQQQRVFIARAIVSKPEILFLDEPTTGVDIKSQENFYRLLGKLNSKGITIVLVSHDIGRITRHVTKVASLNQTLEFYGSHKDFCVYDKKHGHKLSEGEHMLCLHRG
ncbi:MAG: metal ABC transporter ATP-binding protein [Candidatus Aenigmarchaeota archaeon]|nr:metal ABC transporter ATP-binding protein [Candidatus Aenigmarchaeota archaeon]